MAKGGLVTKSNSFMFLMMGSLVVLFSGFFIVNSNLNFKTQAGVLTPTMAGYLKYDPKHLLVCNKGPIKSNYILQESVSLACVGLIIDSTLAAPYINQLVVVNGSLVKNKFYVNAIKPANTGPIAPPTTPWPDFTPSPELPGSGPTGINLY